MKEQLWEISDNRKLEAENERQFVMEEGWLEDRMGLLTNHYLTVMQVGIIIGVIVSWPKQSQNHACEFSGVYLLGSVVRYIRFK